MNTRLRDHVTRIGFNLSLGHTHIAALVRMDLALRNNRWYRAPSPDNWAVGMDGLVRRGLVDHHFNAKAKHEEGLRPHYSITAAGAAVVELLKEAGLYAEYERGMVAA